MFLSVVTTLYKSEEFLDEFLNQTFDSISKIGCEDYEIIFVNDGSPDNSLEKLLKLKEEISQIKIIDLSRNFGHHYAIQAGLHYAQGDYIFLIDNDLETSPRVLEIFYDEFKKNNSLDVVYGYQEKRKGNFIERVFGNTFWKLINMISDVKIPHNILTERLMTKEYVKALLKLNDANLFLGGMMHWVGFNQKGISVVKNQRKGESTYSLKRRFELMVQAITSFSGKPLVWLFYFGLLISFFSICFIFYLGIQKIMYQDQVKLGWTSVVAISILILGIISTFLGVIGIYLFKVFNQVQGRPNFIIKKIHE